MSLHIYRDVEQERTVFADYIQYWSNALGELHYHGQHSITEDELPAPLKRAYQDLFFEAEIGSLRYLVETSNGFGIALINEYDTFTATQFGLSMDDLFEFMAKDAAAIAANPLFEKAEITAAEGMGLGECHELIVTFPADIPKEVFLAAAKKLDDLAYQSGKSVDQKQIDAYKLCDQIQDLQNNPLFWVAHDMAWLSKNCELDEPLSKEEIYTLATKLEEAYSTFTAGLLHEEHLDAIRYMLEYGICEDHTSEFSEVSADDARKLLLSANDQVFATIVETVAINNEIHYEVMNQIILEPEEINAVEKAIAAIQVGEQKTPEPIQPQNPVESTKKESLADKIKDAAVRASQAQTPVEEKHHQSAVEH